ncbi:MAG: flagellar biosynthesis anti-sigma factor FlgM [Gammaproteobacteria bacterium]|nr:MAG: flagellar biosynthesis anti-sigma factor FlgM [Gammaproteobacteria bacterium]
MTIEFSGISPNQGPSQKGKQISQAAENKLDTNSASKAKNSVAIASTGENVSFSAKAQSFQQLENSIKDMPDDNKEKVSAIKAAVDSGSYSVDANKLARNMLDFDSSMF